MADPQDDLAADIASVSTQPDDLAADIASVNVRPPLSAHGVTDPASVHVTEAPYTGGGLERTPSAYGHLVEDGAAGIVRGAAGLAKAQFAPQPADQTIAAGNDLLEGLFKASTPLIAAGAVANPVGTAWALVRASLAAKVGAATADTLGASENVQRLTGNVAALLSGTQHADQFLKGTLVDAAKVMADAAKAKGAALSLAAKLSGSGYGTGDVPGFRANPAFEESTLERAEREASAGRAYQASKDIVEAVAEARAAQPPQEAQRPPQPAPVAQVPASPEALAAQEARVQAMRTVPGQVPLTPAQEAVRTQLSGVQAPSTPEAQPDTPDTLAADIAAVQPETAIADARQEVDTQPTDAQKSVGNYRKGHVTLHGLDITIENPVGSERSGTGKDGTPWSVTMPADYGYIKRTEGADGDHVDIYIGPEPHLSTVYVIDQVDPETKAFDEHKAVIGVWNDAQAQALYESAFADGKGAARFGGITPMSAEQFKTWATDGDTSKPLASIPSTGHLSTDAESPIADLSNNKLARAIADLQNKPGRTSGLSVDTDPIYTEHERARYHALQQARADRNPKKPVTPQIVPAAVADTPETLEADIAAVQPEVAPSAGPTVTYNKERHSIEVAFQSKPAPEILSGLKIDGYKWAKSNKVWYQKVPSLGSDAASNARRDSMLAMVRQSLGLAPQPAAVVPPASEPEKGVESAHGEPTVRGDAGELPTREPGAPESAGAPSESALAAVPAPDESGPDARGETGHGDSGSVLENGVRNPARDEPGPVTLAPDGGVDAPVPVSVSPSGATHDPGPKHGDYDLTAARIQSIISRGTVARVRDNLAAIDLVKSLKADARYATPDEQETLAKYVGWGAGDMAAFLGSYPKHDWSANERALWERIQKLPQDERDALTRSTTNAHFTFDLYRPIWAALERAGFGGGKVLEPAVGVGHAFGFMPADLRAQSTLSASELEPLTAAIAGYLYPSATVQAVGYEQALIARNTQDLVISNVPFGDFGVDDPLLPRFVTERIHNYFFAKAVEHVRPGGLVVFVTSRYTLDSVKFMRVRQHLMAQADFLGAIRLPNTAFDKSAKTEVVTDLIVLRKRDEGQAPADANKLFVQSEEHDGLPPERNWQGKAIGGAIYRSTWYTQHPDYVLGTESREGTMRAGGEYTVTAPREGVLDAMQAALETLLPPGTYRRATRATKTSARVEGPFKVGEYRLGPTKGTIVMVGSDGEAVDVTPRRGDVVDKSAVARLAGLIGIRDALRDTTRVMLDPASTDAQVRTSQKALKKLYDAYTGKHGDLNAPTNKRLFAADPEATNLLGLERLQAKATETTRKDGKIVLMIRYQVTGLSDIFTKRALNPPKEVRSVETPKDALLASLGAHAAIDWPYMARISGATVAQLQEALTADGLVFEQPDGGHVLAEEYLSGDVVTKLADAKAAGTRLAANVVALDAVQPAAKTHEDIQSGVVSVNLGAGWVDPDDYARFADAQLGRSRRSVTVSQIATSTLVRWTAAGDYSATAAAAQHPLAVKYQGGTYDFLSMLNDALNLKLPELGHYEGSGDSRRWVAEPEATLAARANVEALHDLWRTYVYDNEGLRARVLAIYNTRYNRTVERRFDGSHLTYPGMATLYNAAGDVLKFHPHQNNGIWRILATGNTLLAHEVGAGKTFEMIAAAMEMRRTGRAVKPLITVPTYLLGQWRDDIIRLYPNARVAAFDEKDLEAKKRQTAMARIAYNDWDIVLVPHSSFGLLKVSEQRMIDMMERWVDELKGLEAELGKGDDNVKAVERQRRKIEDKVRKKVDQLKDKSNDNALTWEQLGVDALFVDEAHAFKNLFFYSKLENLRGLSRSESDRALDLYVKVQEINEQSQYRNLVLATATPLMNSMAEVYTMQRYLQPQALRQAGFENFDSWYAMFAHANLLTEQQPDGTYKEVRRLRDFSNLQLLSRMVRQVMDYVGWEDMPYLKLPKIAGGKIEIVQTDPHPMYPQIKEWFGKRMQNIRDNPPRWDYRKQEYIAPPRPDALTGADTGKVDNILTIMNDAKKAAVDMRLVLGDRAADFKGSRLQIAATKMATLYKQERSRKGVQLVFLDVGTPKTLAPLEFLRDVVVEDATAGDLKDEEDRVDDEGEDDLLGLIDDGDDAFNLYDALKAALVKRGVPAREIAYIHQARTAAERIALFQAAQRGDVRFVFASTDKGGVGMNIQERLAAIHELDAPRAGRPGDLRQRMGRGVRQGNTYPEVHLVRYVTKGTTDEWLWGMLTTKDYQIRQFMRGDALSVSEEDPSTMSLAEAQMRASGDPRTIELVDLKSKLARLEAQASAGERALAQAASDKQRSASRITALERDLADLTAWLAGTWHSLRGDAFQMTVGSTAYADRQTAQDALLAAAREVGDRKRATGEVVGALGGLPIRAVGGSHIETMANGTSRLVETVDLQLDGDPFGAIPWTVVHMATLDLKDLGAGMNPVAGLVNGYEAIPKRKSDLAATIAAVKDTLAQAERTLGTPHTAIAEAKRARLRVLEIEGVLKAEGLANEETRRNAAKEDAAQKASKENGPTLQATILPGAAEFGEHVLEPAAAKVANLVRHETRLVLSTLAPAKVGVAPAAADVIRAHTAAHDQRTERARRVLEEARKVMDGWSHERVQAFWAVMEGEEPVSSLSRPDRQFVQLFKTLLARWTQQLVDADLLETYLEHYFPHEWKQGSAGGSVLARLLGRRPIQGTEAFRKRRSIPTMREGLAAGLEPASWNPAEQVLRKVVEMSRSLNAREMQRDLKREGFEVYVPATKRPPEAIRHWAKVPEAALGTVYGPRVPEQAFGKVIAGHYYAPPEVVRLLTNYVSPGLWGKSLLFDAYKTVGNLSTSTLLGWSTFHLWMTGIESSISKLSVGLEMASRGEIGAAAKTLMQVGPQGVVRDLLRGYKAVREFYSRDATANDTTGLIGQIVQGGGGFGWSLFEHENAPTKFLSDVRRLLAAVQHGDVGMAAGAAAKAALHGPMAALELPTTIIMNHWVPYLKVSAFLDMAEMELRRLGLEATLADQRKVYGKAWDAVDDRFGQLRYANLFWDNTFKQLLTGGFLSVGWQVGSLRHGLGAGGQGPRLGRALKRALEDGGGGAGKGTPPAGAEPEPDAPTYQEPWTQREAVWLFSLLAVTVTASALYQYLRTGKHLGEAKDGTTDSRLALRDAFYPRNGKEDGSGREQRDVVIGYAKDYFGWTHHPVSTLEHKLKPLLTWLTEMAANENFYGDAIYDANDPATTKLADLLLYVVHSASPIGYQNALRRAGTGATAGQQLKAWAEAQAIPFSPAPAEQERSDAEQYLHDLIPPSHRTKDEAQRAAARREVRQDLRQGQPQVAARAAQAAGLTSRSVRAIARSERLGPLRSAFQATTWPEAVETMTRATPEEKAALKAQFLAKASRALAATRSSEQRTAIMKARNQALNEPVPTS